jgi:cobalamin biosynthesis Mg chelatase CobN
MKLLLKIAIALLFTISIASCKTTKTAIKDTVHVATEQHNDVAAVNNNHTVASNATNISDQSTENDSTVTTTVNEVLSTPDALGNQHPTQRTTTTQKAYRNKKNDVKSGSKTNIDNTNKSKFNKSSDSKSDATTKTQQKEEIKTAMPFWIQKGIAILVALSVIAVFLVLRRYGVIEKLRGAIGRIFGKK